MLVNFYIDPDAVDNDIDAYHIRELRTKWQNLGVLSHPSQDDGGFRDIRRRFRQLNQNKRRIWDRLWREIVNDPTRYLKCRDNFKVVLISERLANNEQIPNGESAYFHSASLGSVEGVRLTEINASQEFASSEEISSRRIAIGERVTDLWQERFQQLAKHSREIVVVDEWAVRDNNFEGLVRFLNLLEDDSNDCAVTIYSSPETELPEQVMTIINNLSDCVAQLDGYGISSIEIRLRPEDDFRIYAHERHIRFDNRVLDIGRGVRIFQFDSVREATRTSFSVLRSGETDDTEYDLNNKSHRISDFCLLIGASNSP